MRVLIDTNVLVDFLTRRPSYYEDARSIIQACQEKQIDGYMAAHSVPDMFYILRKDYPVSSRRAMLKYLCGLLTVSAIDGEKLMQALNEESFDDFEDCLQVQCAKSFQANYIITRNEKDFTGSPIPCIAPDAFCREYLNPGENSPKQETEQGKTPREIP